MLEYDIIALVNLSLYSCKNINVCILIRVYRTDQAHLTDQDLYNRPNLIFISG